jgi:D-3-phosphoglycerate dehydrogenase
VIFVALSTFAERDRRPLERLKASGEAFRLHQTGKRITTPELVRDGRDAAVIVAGVEPYDAETLGALPALRCICRCGVGTDNVDLAAARARGVAVLNTPDLPASAVAELALALFLALSRNLLPQANLVRARRWERLEAHLLGGRCVGVVGLGRIGRRVAELTRAFGARVVASDPVADADWARGAAVELVYVDALLQEADIVSLHAARSEAHPLLMGIEQFARMRRGALFVNLARGSMVDEAALLGALKSGQVAGAGLDVFGTEPYSGPLCDLDNVILTPHSATLTVETRAAMELECVDKALRFLDGSLRREERVV